MEAAHILFGQHTRNVLIPDVKSTLGGLHVITNYHSKADVPSSQQPSLIPAPFTGAHRRVRAAVARVKALVWQFHFTQRWG